MTGSACSYCGEPTESAASSGSVRACEHCYAEGIEQLEGEDQ